MFSLNSSTGRVIDIRAQLNNGTPMPVIGFGTYMINSLDSVRVALDTALHIGYRLIDTAALYGNETEIGQALKELLPKHKLRREDIFITTKLHPSNNDGCEKTVTAAVKKSLLNLDTPYVDLYLIHWPDSNSSGFGGTKNSSIRASTWKIFEKLHNNGSGILKSIGVSNFTVKHLSQLIKVAKIIPAVNQVEFHPYWQQNEQLHDICHDHSILLQAYMSLGSGNKSLLLNSTVNEVAKKNNISSAQVLLRWALQRNYAIIPKSVTPARIKTNANLNNSLSDQDMNNLNTISERVKIDWDPEGIP